MYNCNKCNKEFKSNRNLQLHLNKKIPCDRKIKCKNCLKIFNTIQNLIKHENRKNKCIKVNLEEENKDLKHKIEILELEIKYKDEIIELKSNQVVNNNTTNNTTNNFILNNFGSENLEFITKKFLTDSLKNIINTILPLQIENKTQLKIDKLEYYGSDIKKINIFRLFIKLIFKNEDYPENNTIKYDEENDEFYYYSNDEWVVVDKDSQNILIERIFQKIQQLLLDKKPLKDEKDLKKLELYLGEDYNIKINKINEQDYGLLKHSRFYKKFYNNVLKIEYKDKTKLDNHENNII
jgi:hypothetical protein